MTRLRSLGAARTLLLLAIIALLTHFIADSGLGRPAAKNRFDFSTAICTSGKHAKSDAKSGAKLDAQSGARSGVQSVVQSASTDTARVPLVKAPPIQHQHHAGGECCDLCCGAGAGAAPLANAQPLALASAEVDQASPVAFTARLAPAPQWAPQAARAPPFRF